MARLLFVMLTALALLAVDAPAVAAGGTASVRADAASDGARCGRTRRRPPRRRPAPKKAAPKKAPPPEDKTKDEAPRAEEKASTSGSPLRRSNRMEFDARLVQGQTAQSGAVYLFQRAPRRLPPLLKLRQSYLDRIVEPVFGDDHDEKAKEDR